MLVTIYDYLVGLVCGVFYLYGEEAVWKIVVDTAQLWRLRAVSFIFMYVCMYLFIYLFIYLFKYEIYCPVVSIQHTVLIPTGALLPPINPQFILSF